MQLSCRGKSDLEKINFRLNIWFNISFDLNNRGVLYSEAIPFNVIGPIICVGTIGFLGYKYINEALTWED